MGIEISVISALNTLGLSVYLIADEPYSIIHCSPKLYINVVSLTTDAKPQQFIELQEKYQQEGKLLVHLWEDVWTLKQNQVIGRVKSFLGLNKTLHARKAKLVELSSIEAADFFNNYHLQGFVKAKYHYGLTIDGEIIAMASFSDLRPMKSKGINYTSAELVRFASQNGFTLTGGLSKLIKHFLISKKPNDLMSYADRDWSLGNGYDMLGFELTTVTAPSYLYVDEKTKIRHFPHRLPKKALSAFDEQKELNLDEYLTNNGFETAFNTGNLKYHLYL